MIIAFYTFCSLHTKLKGWKTNVFWVEKKTTTHWHRCPLERRRRRKVCVRGHLENSRFHTGRVYCFGSFTSTPLILLITSIIVACYMCRGLRSGFFSHVKTTSASHYLFFFFADRAPVAREISPISQTNVSSFRRVGFRVAFNQFVRQRRMGFFFFFYYSPSKSFLPVDSR